MTANARHSKAQVRWGTSVEYVERARTALGGRIELDPMSEPAFNAIVKAERIWTEQDDGLVQPWDCETALVNPAGGLVLEAWRKLVAEHEMGHTRRAVWIGFSVEQLCILADEPFHPADFSLLICRNRIDFTTLHPIRRIVESDNRAATHTLECGHVVPMAAKSKKASGRPRVRTEMRCTECIAEPEPNGSPSHGNYVCGLGIAPYVFEAAFAGLGRISHGRMVSVPAAHRRMA